MILVCNRKSKEFISTSAQGRRDERAPREKPSNRTEKSRERRDFGQRGTETESLLCCPLTIEGFRAEMPQCTRWNTYYDWEVTNMQSRAHPRTALPAFRLTRDWHMHSRCTEINTSCYSVALLLHWIRIHPSSLARWKQKPVRAGPGLALMLMFILLIKGSLLSHTFGNGERTTAAVAGVCQQLCINGWSFCWFNLCYISSPQEEMTTRADRALGFWGRKCADGKLFFVCVCVHRQPQAWLQTTV